LFEKLVFSPFLHVFSFLEYSKIFDPSSSSSLSVEEIKTVQQQRTLEEKQEDSGDKNIQEHVENACNVKIEATEATIVVLNELELNLRGWTKGTLLSPQELREVKEKLRRMKQGKTCKTN